MHTLWLASCTKDAFCAVGSVPGGKQAPGRSETRPPSRPCREGTREQHTNESIFVFVRGQLLPPGRPGGGWSEVGQGCQRSRRISHTMAIAKMTLELSRAEGADSPPDGEP